MVACTINALPYDVAFVDAIPVGAAAPNTTLDLTDSTWCTVEGTRFDPPGLRRVEVDTMLTDGSTYTDSKYTNRLLELRLAAQTATPDAVAAQLQALYKQLDRDFNLLKVQPKTSQPVYFRTYRVQPKDVDLITTAQRIAVIKVDIPAAPFGYGPKQVLSPIVVSNDPAAAGSPANPNPYFETNTAGWVVSGGASTFARSTAQAHEGVAAGLLTPDGAAATVVVQVSAHFAATAGNTYRAQVWVRCAATRVVNLNLDWYTAGDGYISSVTVSPTVTANTWTLIEAAGVAPATAGLVGMSVNMGGTPPASNTLFIDEAWVAPVGAGGGNGMYLDVAGVLGDVETPLIMSFNYATPFGAGNLASAYGVRRRGTPANMPTVLQAETMSSAIADTTLQTNDPVMSGPNSNYFRTAFTTSAALVVRLTIALHPSVASNDARGEYQLFLRHRQSSGTAVMQVQASYGASDSVGQNYTLTALTLASNTNRRWTNLGVVSIPAGPDPVYDGPSGTLITARGISVALAAARVSGSGTFDWDCVLLVPADDCYGTVRFTNESGPDQAVLDAYANSAYYLESGSQVRTPTSPFRRTAGLPYVSPDVTNRIVLVVNADPNDAANPNQSDDKTSTATVTPSYWPQYLTLRPVGT